MVARKYTQIFIYALKTRVKFIVDFLFSQSSFLIHIFVFNNLWDYILKDKNIIGYTRQELMWYIIIAEMVTYSVRTIYKRIGDMVKDGQLATMLIRPIGFIKYIFAEESSSIINLTLNVVFAIILGLAFVGPIDVSLFNILIVTISVLLGTVIWIAIQILIGLIAFYTEENRSIYLILQKFMFLVVFVPIEFYGKIVQNILYFLPTTYTVFPPAKLLVHYDNILAIKLIGGQVLSLIVILLVSKFIYKRGVKKINANGG